MAKIKSDKNKEHAYKTIEMDIAGNMLKRVVLLYGQEQYLVDWSIDKICQSYINPSSKDFDFTKINGATSSLTEIRNCCETLPLLSEKRIILVDRLMCLEAETVEDQRWADYFQQIPDSCILLLTSETVDMRRKLVKTIGSVGKIYHFEELDESFLKKFIEKRLKAAAKTAKPAILSEFISQSGYYDKNTEYTLYNLENDLKKLIAFSSGTEIGREDILQTISGNMERDVFALIEALSRNRKEAAFRMLSHLTLYNENEYKILSLICSQFESITQVKEMKDDGNSLQEITTYLGLHEFRAKLMLGLSDKFSLIQLRRILKKVYQVDWQIKSGLLDKNLALELFIASV
jgi:DNA polymerase-3 subunit delta